MMNQIRKGYLIGIIAAITYGLNPLFALHLYRDGFSPESVLFYRFLFATPMLAVWMLFTRVSFRLPRRVFLLTLIGGILLATSCWSWFKSFNVMDSGIGATIMFVYPLVVALIMAIGFHERLSRLAVCGICSAFLGVAVLCRPGEGSVVTFAGVALVILSAVAYAVYMVLVKESGLRELAPETLTFYALFVCVIFTFAQIRFGADLIPLRTLPDLGNALGLAFFPSLLSFLLMAVAIRKIGATRTAILGALEPLTALLIGILVFHEALTVQLVIGMLLILGSVTFVVMERK